MSLLRQSALAALSAIILTASRFAFMAILARHLPLDTFGRFSYALWLVDVSFLVCALGMTGAVSRYVAEFRNLEESFQGFLKVWMPWSIALPLLGGIAVLVGAWLSNYALDAFSKIMLCIWSATSGIMAMYMAALSGLQRFDLICQSNLIAAVVILGGGLLLPPNSNDIAYLFALMALASTLASLPGLIAIMRLRSASAFTLNAGQQRKVYEYAMNMWVVALLWSLVWSRGELPIVKNFLGDAGVATYVVALTLFGGAVQGVMLGISAVAPQLTRLWGNGQKKKAFTLARNIMDFQLLVSGIVALVLIYFGPEILTITFGPSYVGMSGILSILSVGLVSMALANHNHLLQIATDGQYTKKVSFLGLIILIILSLSLIPIISLEGASIARAGTLTILAFISVHSVIQKWGIGVMPLRSVLIVFTLVAGSVCILELWSDLKLASRSLLLGCTIIMLVAMVRDSHRRPVAFLIMHKLENAFNNKNINA